MSMSELKHVSEGPRRFDLFTGGGADAASRRPRKTRCSYRDFSPDVNIRSRRSI